MMRARGVVTAPRQVGVVAHELYARLCNPRCAAAATDRNNNELLANVGNFVNRALKFIYDKFDKKIPGVQSAPTELETTLTEAVRCLLSLSCRTLFATASSTACHFVVLAVLRMGLFGECVSCAGCVSSGCVLWVVSAMSYGCMCACCR
jgi:hypothetical protein